MSDKISIVIPCYNSHDSIGKVFEDIKKLFDNQSKKKFELILVNDCSPDNTLEIIKKLSNKDKRVKAISLSKNFGQHSAIMAGLSIATGDIVVCMDDDGQTPAYAMFNLINKIDEGYDIVFSKYEVKKHSTFRNLGSKFNDYMAQKLIGKPKDLYMGSYLAMNSFVKNEIIKYNNPYPYLGGLLLSVTNNVTNVEMPHEERKKGESSYTLSKLIMLWLNGFTAFSVKPLRVAGVIGALISFFGFIFAVFVFINKMLNPTISVGWSSLISVMIFMGGVTLITLGLIGEYVGRIYLSINKKPQFVVKEKYNIENNEEE